MLETNKHRTILVKILKEIYNDITLSVNLGFKGGTALYFFYNLPRFSTDLDFDLLDIEKLDYILEKIEKILLKYGEIKDKHKKRQTLFFLLSYEKGQHNIKFEINARNFNSKYELKNYLGIPMLVMVTEDMFAHKLVALLDRKQIVNRDIFDIWFFLQNDFDINETIIKLRTNLTLTTYLKKCISVLSKYNDKYILQGIGELIDEKQKEWVRKNLKKEVLFLLKLKVDNMKI